MKSQTARSLKPSGGRPGGKRVNIVAQGESFAALQEKLLAKHSKVGERAPGRARVDLIIETAIKLLAIHKREDITMAMIATAGNMTRTSIYAFFTNVDEVFEQVAIRFIKQTGIFVEGYVRERNPRSIEDVAILMIKGIQVHFNAPHKNTPGALARHVPFEARQAIKDFDKVAALSYHTIWKLDWPIEPLSEEDPFRTLVTLQSALFDVSLKSHGKITDQCVDDVTGVALDLIRRAKKRFGVKPAAPSNALSRITQAAEKLHEAGEERLLKAAVSQIEALAAAIERS